MEGLHRGVAAVCLLNYSLFPDVTEPLTRVITPLGSFSLFYQQFAFFTAHRHLPIILIINITCAATGRFGRKYPLLIFLFLP